MLKIKDHRNVKEEEWVITKEHGMNRCPAAAQSTFRLMQTICAKFAQSSLFHLSVWPFHVSRPHTNKTPADFSSFTIVWHPKLTSLILKVYLLRI